MYVTICISTYLGFGFGFWECALSCIVDIEHVNVAKQCLTFSHIQKYIWNVFPRKYYTIVIQMKNPRNYISSIQQSIDDPRTFALSNKMIPQKCTDTETVQHLLKCCIHFTEKKGMLLLKTYGYAYLFSMVFKRPIH